MVSSARKQIVAVCGGLNWDMISVGRRLPDAGETFNASSFEQLPGGKGANTAIAIHRMSHHHPSADDKGNAPRAVNSLYDSDDCEVEVHMVGSVGTDTFGDKMRESLEKKHWVNIDGVRKQEGKQSAVAVTWVESNTGENRIFVYPGANHLLGEEFNTLDAFKCRPDLVVSQLELNHDVVYQLLRTAIDTGVDTLLNPSPANVLDRDVFKGMTHLIMNESEAVIMMGQQITFRPIGDEDDKMLCTLEELKGITDRFRKFGVENVVVTLGKHGAFCSNESIPLGKLVPAVPVERPKDTSGAGDTFVGAYAVRWIRSKQAGLTWDLEDAVQYACRAAAYIIQEVGCQDAIPWANQLWGGTLASSSP